jgi:hypothetical protein
MIKNYAGSFVRRSLTAVLAVVLSSALLGTSAQAGPIIVGSEAFTQQNGVAITPLPTPDGVYNATSFMGVALATNANATGDFTVVNSNYQLSPTFTVPVANTPPPTSFSFSDGGFGMFTATSETVFFQGGNATNGFADLVFHGIFAPGTLFTGLSPNTDATFNISFTQSGGSISESATLSMAAVPEPASFALLGIGISGFIAFRRRFSKSKKPPVA